MSDRVSAERDAIRATTDAATEGPWRAEPNTGAGRVWVQIGRQRHDADCEPLFNVRGGAEYAQREADAAFIVAARSAMPRLLAAVEAVLELTAEFNVEDGHYPDPGMPPVSRADRIRAAITRELTREDGR